MTLAVSAAGAGLGYALAFPAHLLTGPALLVSALALIGVRMEIVPLVRDLAFLVIGIGIGSTVTDEATAAMLRWPMAFAALAVSLLVTMGLCQLVLQRGFGFDRRSAVLASAPGHLSFVISLSALLDVDTLRVTVVQSVRLLALTLLVPVIARAMGVEISAQPLAGLGTMSWAAFFGLMAGSLVVGLILQRLRMPAALLIGAMVTSAVAHGAGHVTGGLSAPLALMSFVTLGGLIGTRFSGISLSALRNAAGAGLAITLVACAVAFLAAIPVSVALGMQPATVLAAFAPGGFETMIALGAVLGANPGFVAACHVARLLILTVLIPLSLRQRRF